MADHSSYYHFFGLSQSTLLDRPLALLPATLIWCEWLKRCFTDEDEWGHNADGGAACDAWEALLEF